MEGTECTGWGCACAHDAQDIAISTNDFYYCVAAECFLWVILNNTFLINPCDMQEHAALQGVSQLDFHQSHMERFDQKAIKKMAGDALLGLTYNNYCINHYLIFIYDVFFSALP